MTLLQSVCINHLKTLTLSLLAYLGHFLCIFVKSNEVPNHCHSLSQKESSAIFTQNFCSRFVYCLQARVLIERQGERQLEGGGGGGFRGFLKFGFAAGEIELR